MPPNLLCMRSEVRLPGELVFGSTNTYEGEEITSYGVYVDILRARMQHAHEIGRTYMSAASTEVKSFITQK